MKPYISLCLVIGFCLIITSTTSSSNILGKLIIDTDAGGDDAAAILLALGAEKHLKNSTFEVIAITCTYGNTNVTNVATNVLKILTIANRSDIPVYVGAHRPIMKHFTQGNYFGEDGFGDFDFDEVILGEIDPSKHASLAMVDLARQHAGNLSVMALGPLTNIALAITLDSSFAENIERFYIMGSSVHGHGNVAPNVEFNFSQDPHGNFIVLNSTIEQSVHLLPSETSLNAAISTEWRKNVLGSLDSRTMEYLDKIEKPILHEPLWDPADLMVIALAIMPQLVNETLEVNLTPVFDGAAEGSVLVDYARTTGKPTNVVIVEAFDVLNFKQLLLDIFSH